MSADKNSRRSHCNICGKRLSAKTSAGEIRWKPGQVDDEGLYCIDCYPQRHEKPDTKKPSRSA